MPSVAKAEPMASVDTAALRPVRAVADFLCISRSKVYQLMEAGHLPYVKLGKSRRVKWADVLKLVENNTVSRGGV
jgi:excisionase family DNA binding protein